MERIRPLLLQKQRPLVLKMFGILGLFLRDGRSFNQVLLKMMYQGMPDTENNGFDLWNDEYVGLGQFQYKLFFEPKLQQRSINDVRNGISFVCKARLDNRNEIKSVLKINAVDGLKCSDEDIIREAYYRWGEHCTERLYGDWSFAAWHHRERQMFLARDHYGITSLYYYIDKKVFAFASSRQAILAMGIVPKEMDELYLAQVLTSWNAYEGDRTIHSSIRRLPPAHHLMVSKDNMKIQKYWFLDKTQPLRLQRRDDYVAAFREVFDNAVHSRLHDALSMQAKQGSVATELSGGLDSGAVTATAARFMATVGRHIASYISIPIYDTAHYEGTRFGDELDLAKAAAHFAGNVDLHCVNAADNTPIQAIRKMLSIWKEPAHAAGNFFWMLELRRLAQLQGRKILLIGQFGNGAASWKGDVLSQPLCFQLRKMGFSNLVKEKIKRGLPQQCRVIAYRFRDPMNYYRSSAINPKFADRLKIIEQRLNDPNDQYPRKTSDLRRLMSSGRSIGGALHAEIGAAFGLEVRDPTADVRVLEFCFAIPDHIFVDPETGVDRWLIREAMKGRLPDEVRLNRKRGRQAGDLVPRLRASAGEVDEALNALARGPASEFVDVPYMRQVWQAVQIENTPASHIKSVSILTRGIMAGLFVNDFYA